MIDKLVRKLGIERKAVIICLGGTAVAVLMLVGGICFLAMKDFLYGAVMCGCAILAGFCVALFRAKCLMDEELRSYDERGRELSRTACVWDWNGTDGEGELVFFKKGLACEVDGDEMVPFVAFSAMSHCGLDGDGAMVVLKNKAGVLVLGGGAPSRAKGILSRLESNGVTVKAM